MGAVVVLLWAACSGCAPAPDAADETGTDAEPRCGLADVEVTGQALVDGVPCDPCSLEDGPRPAAVFSTTCPGTIAWIWVGSCVVDIIEWTDPGGVYHAIRVDTCPGEPEDFWVSLDDPLVHQSIGFVHLLTDPEPGEYSVALRFHPARQEDEPFPPARFTVAIDVP